MGHFKLTHDQPLVTMDASQAGISFDAARIAPMAVPELKPPIGREPPFTCTPTISPVFP